MDKVISCTDNTLDEVEIVKMTEIVKSMEGLTLNSVMRILNHIEKHAVTEYRIESPIVN